MAQQQPIRVVVEKKPSGCWGVLGLMLLIAIHRNDPVIMVAVGILKGINNALAISAVGGMAKKLDTGRAAFGFGAALLHNAFENLRRAVGAAIVYEKDLIVKLANLGQNLFDVAAFVKNGDGDEQSQSQLLYARQRQAIVELLCGVVNL